MTPTPREGARTMSRSVEFDYLRQIARQYGDLLTEEDFHRCADTRDSQQLRELASAYDAIDSRGHVRAISEWLVHRTTTAVDERERLFSWQVGRLLLLFGYLEKKGIAPFSSGRVRIIEEKKTPNWGNLPSELQYLVDAVQHCGQLSTEGDVMSFLDRASDGDLEVLARTAEQIRLHGHMKAINEWMDRFPLTEYQEAWLVYCLLLLMDHANLLEGL